MIHIKRLALGLLFIMSAVSVILLVAYAVSSKVLLIVLFVALIIMFAYAIGHIVEE